MSNRIIFILLISIIIIHVLLLSRLIYFPYPELFIYPYLTNQGLKPYAQILDQHFPGLMFLPINLNNLGMVTPEIARIWSALLVIITQVMLFFVSLEIFKSRTKALLISILYLMWQPFFEGWVLWIDSFLPLLLLPALYFLLKKRFFWTGLFLGLGIVFKQILIPLSGLIFIYLFWKYKDYKIILRYLSGLFTPVALMLIYLTAIGVLSDFFYWTVIFNLTTFAHFGRGAGPTFAHLVRVILVFGTPLLIIRKIRLWDAQILIIFLIGTLVGLTTRFDFVHFQPALPFAILATVYGLRGFGLQAVYLLIAVWWLTTFYKGHLGDRVIAFDSQTYGLSEKIKFYTNPTEKIFVYGGQPHLYQMSETLPAGDVFVFQFPWFMQVAESRILAGIIKDKPRIIVSDRTVKIENTNISDFAPRIDKYINENYQKIDSVGTADIMEKR